jgi:hypothetical protein
MMSGAVEHFAQRHASTRDRAAARISEILNQQGLGPDEVAEALAATAAGYVGDECWYRDEALSLLADAGADLDRAARLHALRAAQRRIRFGDAEL